MKTAILVDGGFYRQRSYACHGDKTPKERAEELYSYCLRHLKNEQFGNTSYSDLYRIFYYDCPPMSKKVFHPLLKKQVDFSKTPLFNWMTDFLKELTSKRKVALRLGKLGAEQACYGLKTDSVKKLCRGTISIESLQENDFCLNLEQKGVDMKIGLDIASLSFKKQVDQIILISGDSDFVSAAKHARREGIDFVLDSLGAPIKLDLHEHIDGLSIRDNVYRTTQKSTKTK